MTVGCPSLVELGIVFNGDPATIVMSVRLVRRNIRKLEKRHALVLLDLIEPSEVDLRSESIR